MINIYNISSGDFDPNNDYINIHASMDASETSFVSIYNVDGTGVIQYNTRSDYLWKVERKKYFSESNVALKSSQSSKLGYPEYFSWAPGGNISVLSNDERIENNEYLPLTQKNDISDADIEKSNILVLSDYYDDPWVPSGAVVVDQVYSTKIGADSSVGDPPFVSLTTGESTQPVSGFMDTLQPILGLSEAEKEAVKQNTKQICKFQLSSSSLEGSVFSFNIVKNFLGSDYFGVGSESLPIQFGRIKLNKTDNLSTLREWNSIFTINDACNVDSIFRNGTNRDAAFYSELEQYINENWSGRLKDHLWGKYINDETCPLSTRDSTKLKNHILYCYYYFGVSDDVYSLALKAYPDYKAQVGVQTVMRWHIGLGGKSKYSKNKRFITEEYSYLPTISEYKTVSKVMGLPPRTLYIYSVANNRNIASVIGDEPVEVQTVDLDFESLLQARSILWWEGVDSYLQMREQSLETSFPSVELFEEVDDNSYMPRESSFESDEGNKQYFEPTGSDITITEDTEIYD